MHWTREEVEAVVADYFAMLRAELSGLPYSKTEHRRKLLPLLRNRSGPSVEFKRANISAVLIEHGFPYIAGYRPRSNYQELLLEVVAERLASDLGLVHLAAVDTATVVPVPHVDNILAALCNPPRRMRHTLEKSFSRPRPGINYLEIEASNRALGLAGEEFVLEYERARLESVGCSYLVDKIEHVSKNRGDSEGFDILSFEPSGAERLVEVKTTKYGRETPFFVSRNEVLVSRRDAERYHLYRLFEFRGTPRFFVLQGALPITCVLEPTSYIATVA
jgi:hypothetical protein